MKYREDGAPSGVLPFYSWFALNGKDAQEKKTLAVVSERWGESVPWGGGGRREEPEHGIIESWPLQLLGPQQRPF